MGPLQRGAPARKKRLKTAAQRAAVSRLMERHGLSQHRAQADGFGRTPKILVLGSMSDPQALYLTTGLCIA
jgi:hypothetical protein